MTQPAGQASQTGQAGSTSQPSQTGQGPGPGTAVTTNRAATPSKRSTESMPTPNRLRLWRILVVALCLITAGVSMVLMFSARGSVQQAADSTQQLIRVHQIKTSLLQADADATTSFLTGQEGPEYAESIDRASELVVSAAESQAADRDALARLNTAIVEYNATTSLARANNRQNFPVGAAYLDDAGNQLRTQALPVIDELIIDNTRRLEQQAKLPSMWLVLVIQIIPVGVMGFVIYRIARHFKRVLNIGLSAAALALIASLVLGVAVSGSAINDVRSITDRHLVSAIQIAEARSHAFDAKAYEGLSLISRAKAGEYNSHWQVASLNVTESLARADRADLADLWRTNEVNHRKIRSLDADGDFEGAKGLATNDEVIADFDEFDTSSAQALQQLSDRSVDGLHQLQPRLLLAGIASGVLGVAAAALAAWGISVRLREYR